MSTGIILLVFLAIIVAFLWNKFRGRFGGKPSTKPWIGPMVAFIVLVLLLWASHRGH